MTAHELIEGTVLRTTRRSATIADARGTMHVAVNPPRSLDLCAGDNVRFSDRAGSAFIEEMLPRKNCLKRSVPEREKRLAANLDHLFIVSALPPLFNPLLIDRMACAASTEKIPVTILINKIDLDPSAVATLCTVYAASGFGVLPLSVKDSSGLNELRALLRSPALRKVALAGSSGVGKSSLLNVLIPGAKARVSEVSEKTGQGKQTTSSAFAHRYVRPEDGGSEDLLIIDLPGIQHYGLFHLSIEEARFSFSELREASAHCQFADCSHRHEPGCEVCRRLAQGLLPASRYESYLDIVSELEAAPLY